MAMIRLTCDSYLKASVPLAAWVKREAIFGADKAAVPVLHLTIGADHVTIWPCDDETLALFQEQLGKARQQLAAMTSRKPDPPN